MKKIEPRQRYKVESITIDNPERCDELIQQFLNTEAGTNWKYISMFVRAEARMNIVQNQAQPKQVLIVMAVFEEMGLFSRLNTIPPRTIKEEVTELKRLETGENKSEDEASPQSA